MLDYGGVFFSLGTGRVLAGVEGAAGGHRAEGSKREDGGVVGVSGRRPAARQVSNLYCACLPAAVLLQEHFLLHLLQV